MAVNCYLKLPGVPGESIDKVHLHEIEISSWSWGEAMPGSFPTFPTKSDFDFQGKLDAAAPKLMLALATGKMMSPAVLTCLRTNPKTGAVVPYLTITLSNVFVSSLQLTGDGSTGLGEDSFSLNFQQIDIKYTTQSGQVIETAFDFNVGG